MVPRFVERCLCEFEEAGEVGRAESIDPSAMFPGDEADESLIWSRYLKSFEAGPVEGNATTSHFNA